MREFKSVTISGNLLSESLLRTIGSDNTNHKYIKPSSFRWYKNDNSDTQKKHDFKINTAYDRILSKWDMHSNDFSEMSISQLREKWLKFFFAQFEYDLHYLRKNQKAGDLEFNLSHRGWNNKVAPIIHTVPFDQNLDEKLDDDARYSPHDKLQKYLINNTDETWGIVSNGCQLRILRDFFHETRKAYVEFDLEMVFEARNFKDFRLMWRLIHPSRFLNGEDDQLILEDLFQESKSAGVAIGEDLRYNVRRAIEILGNGFLHSNSELLEDLLADQKQCEQFHHQILRVIYRIIFLLYAEQRNLMPGQASLYFKEYSITALREKIESGYIPDDKYTDLWEGLKATFQMVNKGVKKLDIPTYNGLLFDPYEIDMLINLKCENRTILEAIQYLTTFKKEGMLNRISYVELGVDEIGSIYESLLDYIPRISNKPESFEDSVIEKGKSKTKERTVPAQTFFLDPRGTTRKTSGSYYTNPRLVSRLIDSALKPVMQDKLDQAADSKEAQINAILSIKICDPACGSGAFLIAATEFLGLEMARIMANDDYPSDGHIRHGRREVLRHCIYGVDLNPLAVELTKISLWLTAATNDQPLNFLDHHIKCGNSLIGATPELIKEGIPAYAYQPVIGDKRKLCNKRKRELRKYYRNKEKHEKQVGIAFQQYTDTYVINEPDLSNKFNEDNSDNISEMKQKYYSSREKKEFKFKKMLADLWTAAFFWQHDDPDQPYPDPNTLDELIDREYINLEDNFRKKIEEIADKFKFFHWHLEFPEVFEKGGFDCMLGNPPWENIQPEEKQFFAHYNSKIADMSGNKRKKEIKKLKDSNPQLLNKWNKHKREVKVFSKFLRESGRFELTASGKLNTYSIFTENFRDTINKTGRAGLIVPTGIATDHSTRDFFAALNNTNSIASLYDFVNKEAIFNEVHRSYKFSLLTISGTNVESPKFSFFLTSIDQLHQDIREFELTPEDINMINPNTKTTPIFRTRVDAELTKKIYKNVSVLINEELGKNPWKVSFKQGLFNMTSDSNLFHTSPGKHRLPLYEAKMIWQYNHRFGTYENYDQSSSSTHLETPDEEQYKDPNFTVQPRYWVDKIEVLKKVADIDPEEFESLDSLEKNNFIKNNLPDWYIGFRDITNTTNERTSIFSLVPNSGVGNSLPLIISDLFPDKKLSCLLADFNSIVFDIVARQKLGGTHMNFYILKQLPVLPPDIYSNKDIDFIKQRVLVLVYTAYDLKPFAEDMGYDGEPFEWDEERRAILKAELDAYYAKLYGLNRKQLRYILDPADLTEKELQDILSPSEEVSDPLDEEGYQKRCAESDFPGETFRVLKEKQIKQFGEYRKRRLVLEAWERLEKGEI